MGWMAFIKRLHGKLKKNIVERPFSSVSFEIINNIWFLADSHFYGDRFSPQV